MTNTSDSLKTDIKQAIVRSLRLPITADEIGDATPLFGEGLGLDSIDVLELVLELERSFGVLDRRRADRGRGAAIGRYHRRLHRQAQGGRAPPDSRVSPRMPGGTPPRNVFTVDLEEWFHVCGVGGPLAPDQWDRLPSRVESTTRRVLDLLDEAGVRATFFVVGWVAERHPRLVEQSPERRPRDRFARLRASARVRPGPGRFSAGSPRQRGGARARRRR